MVPRRPRRRDSRRVAGPMAASRSWRPWTAWTSSWSRRPAWRRCPRCWRRCDAGRTRGARQQGDAGHRRPPRRGRARRAAAATRSTACGRSTASTRRSGNACSGNGSPTSSVSCSPRAAVRSAAVAGDRSPSVTPEEALAHPTWRMGPKITIDSATLVNKAFEVIEAKWLYRLPYSKIDAVIHPQSVVHSLVEFADGSYKAQLGLPDMRLPIQYALTHPDRLPSPARRSSIRRTGVPSSSLPWPMAPIPAYDVVRAAAAAGGNRGTVLNAADEAAVAAFLDGRIGFPTSPHDRRGGRPVGDRRRAEPGPPSSRSTPRSAAPWTRSCG